MSETSGEGIRLQKVMAAAGVGSRRVSEEMIVAGRVRLNGQIVTELGTRVDPTVARVSVDGKPVQLDVSRAYVMLNKPTGVVSSMRDDRGRPDLRQYTVSYEERLFNVGRLDSDTSGLLLLTNDGEVAHVLAHPSFGIPKTYVATVKGIVRSRVKQQLLAGLELEDGSIAADSVRVRDVSAAGGTSIVELSLHSGRNRIVRRMLSAVGHPVYELVRRQFGPLKLGALAVGETRELTRIEVGQLLTIVREGSPRKES